MGRGRAKQQWHPLVSTVLAMLTRSTGPPTLDEQLSLGSWLASLPESEHERAMGELGLIVKRLLDAHEEPCARLVRGIALLASQQEAMPHAAARVRHSLEHS